MEYQLNCACSSRRAQDDAEMAALPQVVFESNSILNGIQFVLQDTTEEDYTKTYFSNTAFRVSIIIIYTGILCPITRIGHCKV